MTIQLVPGLRVFVATGITDMRKSFNGLAATTRAVLQEDPLSGDLFVFCNRRRTLIKLLVFDGTGFWVFAKRLERGTFAWPQPADGVDKITLSSEELGALLGGVVVDLSTRRRGGRREPLRFTPP